jgi:uncharacterized sodium:solute symporter family permease YidK
MIVKEMGFFLLIEVIWWICIVLQDMNVNCLAVINDTVGALMSCAHDDRNCAIGLILGKLLLKVEIIQWWLTKGTIARHLNPLNI